MNSREQQLQAFNRLLDIIDDLRSQCPWDQKQTFESLRHLTIEETYELGDAILENKLDEIKKELGDLLMHIAFYSKIGSETNHFDIADVANSISEKLIHRHPHIYGDVKVTSADDVKTNWENLKLKEGKKSVLEGVPQSLPAMVKSYRMQEKVASVGFDWPTKEAVWVKVEEELQEFKAEVALNSDKMEAELGDVFFALINYARFINVNPESALERTNKEFIRRFQHIEKEAAKINKKLTDMTLAEMDVFWNEAKKLS
ncbi:MAG: nucleoside triphosphate pyrophosphohydrolase [Flavobacteriaceae bacterium]|jgi:XTP/dITP diphosphohydrolase|nr:nucleoside triphosphate pyrophosphohydrolase [Flavobacteriaceae bacterium]